MKINNAVQACTWVILGHRPRPMLDDPKYIGGLMNIAYFLPGFLLMGLPILAPLGLAASFSLPSRTQSFRYGIAATLAAIYIMACSGVIMLLRQDPGRVVEWWFD